MNSGVPSNLQENFMELFQELSSKRQLLIMQFFQSSPRHITAFIDIVNKKIQAKNVDELMRVVDEEVKVFSE